MSVKENVFVSAVIYVYNNGDIIKETLQTICGELYENFSNVEIICVDDASNDDSAEQIKLFAAANEYAINIVHMSFYHGLDSAITAGTDLAIGDFVFEIDGAYIDYESKLLLDVYKKALEGFDIVSAQPKRYRARFSRIFYHIFNRFSKINYKITTERFRILSRRAINRIDSLSDSLLYRKAQYAASGLTVSSIGYNNTPFKLRINSKAYTNNRKNTAFNSLILFTDLAYKISFTLSVLMAVFMIASGIYTGISYFMGVDIVRGWVPLMGLISAGFFGVFIILTILLGYMDVLLNLVYNKQKYLIASIEKLNRKIL
jgi:dolichol-phosphate mannosyltransferase